MSDGERLLGSIQPLLVAVGGTVVDPAEMVDGDIALEWDGVTVAAVRLASLDDALDHLIAQVERELGAKLKVMTRTKKQTAIRVLDERGAFAVRRAVEVVADAMGVSRITVYNYLNAIRNDPVQR